MNVKVFIQNEAGSNRKHHHDEKTLQWRRTVEVSRPYPFPYGFILGTTCADGGNLDCFVITEQRIASGDLLDCEVIGLMEQFEDDLEDHNILVRLPKEAVTITTQIESMLTEFVSHVFDHVEGKQMHIGRFLGKARGEAHVRACTDEDQFRESVHMRVPGTGSP